MPKLKPVILLIASIAAVLALLAALFWRQLLPPQAKLRHGLTFEATRELGGELHKSPTNKKLLDDYVGALVREGNLGRAFYLIDLYGAKNGSSEQGFDDANLSGLRQALQKSQEQMQHILVYDIHRDVVAQAFKKEPLYQALLYLQGYQYGVTGDWKSALNMLAAIKPQKLPPPLKPDYLYFLARAYRMAGSADQKHQIESVYKQLFSSPATPALKARARYNLLAWYLSADYPNADGEQRASAVRNQVDADDPAQRWAAQKADVELAQYYWQKKDIASAWSHSFGALKAGPEDKGALAAGQLLQVVFRTLRERKWPDGSALTAGIDAQGKVTLPLADGSLLNWARSGIANGYAIFVLRELSPMAAQLDPKLRSEVIQAESEVLGSGSNAEGLQKLTQVDGFGTFPAEVRAEVRYQLGLALAAHKQWNAALGQFSAVQAIGKSRVAESMYERYVILKQVQEPLNLEVATGLLRGIVDNYADSRPAPKAAEELLPLLIYYGKVDDAKALIAKTAAADFGGNARQSREEDYAKLRALGQFWSVYLAERAGDTASAQAVREACTKDSAPFHWSYYELALGGPCKGAARAGQYAPLPLAALPQGESATEYLAGLGLTTEASEEELEEHPAAVKQSAAKGQAAIIQPSRANSSVILYNQLRVWQALGVTQSQYNASAVLDSGAVDCNEAPLVNAALKLAFPTPYKEQVTKAATESRVDPALIYAVMKKESNFREGEKSSAGAVGLMQLLPSTAGELAKQRSLPATPLTDPEVNIRLGTAYLRTLEDQVASVAAPLPVHISDADADSKAALTRAVLHSYNGGPANYGKWRKLYPTADAVLLADLVPNEENEDYVKRVWKFYMVYKHLLAQP